MIKITITRSQVAQLYTELTSDNLKETFFVDGDEVMSEDLETETTPDTATTADTTNTEPAESDTTSVPADTGVTPPASEPETAS